MGGFDNHDLFYLRGIGLKQDSDVHQNQVSKFQCAGEFMSKKKLLLGNEAIAYGLLAGGCSTITSYPGTPASEILSSVAKLKQENDLQIHVEWSINEKVAFETALANSYAGRRSAVAMKQVGLNVAMDPLMSAAYTGVKGGMVAVVADDPGPHSSQTEQDTRFFAMAAKVPVFDPISPEDCFSLVPQALEVSENFEIPAIFRPTTRVSHARQDVEVPENLEIKLSPALFEKEPTRWAATPKFRFLLHKALNEKLRRIATLDQFKPFELNPGTGEKGKTCIVGSGVVLTYVWEIMRDLGILGQVPIYRAPMPFPLNTEFTGWILEKYDRILVLEETYPVLEYQLRDRRKTFGRLNGMVPEEGELLPEVVEDILVNFLELQPRKRPTPQDAPPRRPTLCPGCPHRASFYALRKVFRKGIYPGDIGCYTLGLNLNAVDTVLCMGAAISKAAGFYHSYKYHEEDNSPAIVATIGDSTFFHSGIPALINAVTEDARFVLLILDNSTTAMTGNQPTPATGKKASGKTAARKISIARLVEACGVDFVEESDPYDLKSFIEILKEAREYTQSPEGGIAVVIAKHPCLMDKEYRRQMKKIRVKITDRCKTCHYCIDNFECPALIDTGDKERVTIDYSICTGCGVCISVCPKKAIVAA